MADILSSTLSLAESESAREQDISSQASANKLCFKCIAWVGNARKRLNDRENQG